MVEESAPVSAVVGGKTAAVLEKVFGIATAGDLLRHYPRRYYERGELADLSTLRAGDQVTLAGPGREDHRPSDPTQVVQDRPDRDRRVGGSLLVTFFNRRYLERQLVVGDTVVLAGEVEWFGKRLQLKQPEVNLDSDVEDVAGTLMPVYPATKGLQSWQIRKAIRTALPMVDVPDVVPEPLRKQRGLVGIDEALRGIHMPEDWPQVNRAQARLRYDEAFLLQVVLAQRRALAALEPTTPRTPRPDGLLAAFDATLPFTLTAGQQ